MSACSGQAAKDRIIVIGLDGFDPAVVQTLIAEGKLPHFARMRREGAFGPLRASDPVLISPVLWTTIATGKTAAEHGIDHFVAINPKTGRQVPVTSGMRRVKALWQIASTAGRKVGVVGWWATWPAESVNGAVVSDHTCYHFLFPEAAAGGSSPAGLTHPPDLDREIAPLVRRPTDISAKESIGWVSVDPKEFDRPFDFADPLSHFRWALATAESYRRIGLHLIEKRRPDLLMVYIEATDSVSHLFGHLFRATGLAGELAEQLAHYGGAVERTYVYADDLVGEYMEAMDARTTLVVLSDHGFALGALPDDPTETRDLRRVSEKYHRPEGILYLYGNRVRSGTKLAGAQHLDVTPTLLALLGLGRANDMPGRVLGEALELPAVTAAVATYETGPHPSTAAREDPEVDPELLARLKSLGYLDARNSPQADRHVAERYFAQGRFEEAERMYRELVGQSPKDATLHTSLAGALAGLERYPEALAELHVALELDPLSAAARQNRGAIFERQDRQAAAVNEYRTALKYEPDYAPAREALERLSGHADAGQPSTAREAKALALAEKGREAAKRGDYAEAGRLLTEAERTAPRLAVVYQYEANVAYLKGDRKAAIAALRRALALDPGNALYAQNLKALEHPKQPARPR